MSKPRHIALITLVFIAAAALAALPSLWPGFRPYMEDTDLALMFTAGWITRGNQLRSRQLAKRPQFRALKEVSGR